MHPLITQGGHTTQAESEPQPVNKASEAYAND